MTGSAGKWHPDCGRLSMNGGIAVKTRSGYRSYDPDLKRLTNCDSFVLDIGEEFFFVVPVSRVRPGDIILAGGTPRCVIAADGETITAINFEDATVETLLPEHHLFMGNTYLYGKIVSVFGRNGVKGKKGMGRMMKYMMLSGMMKNRDGGAGGLLPLMLMGGKTDFMDELFTDDEEPETDGKTEEEA